MKGLSEKAKAEAYDKIVDMAKKELNACGSKDCDAARQIFRLFPELAESNDEKIRKDIISYLALYKDAIGEEYESWIAWLEKQGEQYYSCESDIDFKIEADKWYVCIKDYYYSDIDELMFTKGKAYKAYIDWGFISNNGTKKTPIGLFPYKEYFRPATDEEIPHEQKPAELNDDDKQCLLVCKNALYKYQVSDKWDANIIYQWLEDKVKSSVQQPKQSEEDEKILSDIIKDLVHPWNEYIPDRIEDEIKWLKNRIKSLRPQNKNTSKEFKDTIREVKTKIAQCNGFNKKNREEVFGLIDSLRPRNRWKPSDEQMEAVKRASNGSRAIYGNDYLIMESLYQDLKKLREG